MAVSFGLQTQRVDPGGGGFYSERLFDAPAVVVDSWPNRGSNRGCCRTVVVTLGVYFEEKGQKFCSFDFSDPRRYCASAHVTYITNPPPPLQKRPPCLGIAWGRQKSCFAGRVPSFSRLRKAPKGLRSAVPFHKKRVLAQREGRGGVSMAM